MKQLLQKLLLWLLCFYTAIPLQGQNCDETTAIGYLQANRLKAAIRNGGDLFSDGQSGQFVTPLGNSTTETRTAIYSAGIWLGGYDTGGNLHMAAQTYRQAGNDFWAGPIDSLTGNTDSLTCLRFDNIWVVDILDVMTVIEDYEKDGIINGTIPTALQIWPARGNTFYPLQYGFNLPDQDLAPFFDRNNDGIYNPYHGDYPVYEQGNPTAIADEMAWAVFNDKANTHEVTHTAPLGVELNLIQFCI